MVRRGGNSLHRIVLPHRQHPCTAAATAGAPAPAPAPARSAPRHDDIQHYVDLDVHARRFADINAGTPSAGVHHTVQRRRTSRATERRNAHHPVTSTPQVAAPPHIAPPPQVAPPLKVAPQLPPPPPHEHLALLLLLCEKERELQAQRELLAEREVAIEYLLEELRREREVVERERLERVKWRDETDRFGREVRGVEGWRDEVAESLGVGGMEAEKGVHWSLPFQDRLPREFQRGEGVENKTPERTASAQWGLGRTLTPAPPLPNFLGLPILVPERVSAPEIVSRDFRDHLQREGPADSNRAKGPSSLDGQVSTTSSTGSLQLLRREYRPQQRRQNQGDEQRPRGVGRRRSSSRISRMPRLGLRSFTQALAREAAIEGGGYGAAEGLLWEDDDGDGGVGIEENLFAGGQSAPALSDWEREEQDFYSAWAEYTRDIPPDQSRQSPGIGIGGSVGERREWHLRPPSRGWTLWRKCLAELDAEGEGEGRGRKRKRSPQRGGGGWGRSASGNRMGWLDCE